MPAFTLQAAFRTICIRLAEPMYVKPRDEFTWGHIEVHYIVARTNVRNAGDKYPHGTVLISPIFYLDAGQNDISEQCQIPAELPIARNAGDQETVPFRIVYPAIDSGPVVVK